MMHYDVCILSDEEPFARMLYLELTDRGRSVTVVASPEDLPPCDLCFADRDRFPDFSSSCRTVFYGRSVSPADPAALHRPFMIEDAVALAEGRSVRRGLVLLAEECAVLLNGERICLTRLEYALLARLSAENGNPVSRDALYREIFGGEGDDGIVNVYIHYLRRKLESNGRRLIFSLRGRGYALREEGRP